MPGVNDQKARRVLTRNACMRCRARKAKCDGKRPSCQSCLAKELNCVYDTACEDTTKMQSLQSQLACMKKQLSSTTADLDSCMNVLNRFQQATEREAHDLLARFRAGDDIEERRETRCPSDDHQSPSLATAMTQGSLSPMPKLQDDVPGVQVTRHSEQPSCHALSVSFATQPERDSPEKPIHATSIPQKRQMSLSNAVGLFREPSLTQICPFGSHLSIMQWDSNLTSQFDACLQAGVSALSPSYRARCDFLLSLPAADITSDDLMYQVSGLLAMTSSDCQRRHFSTWPILNWIRYNVLGALRTALSGPNARSGILAYVVAILTGWEQMHGDPAAFQIHLMALREMASDRGTRRSSGPMVDASLHPSSSLIVSGRLPDGFGHLLVLGLLPSALLDLIARLTPADPYKQEDMDEWRRVSIMLAALRPTSRAAINALVSGELGLKVTECVRLSAMMFITLNLAVTDNDHWNQPMLSAIEPTYADSHPIITENLVGSVYDEILLWCLCVFYALVGRLIERQLICFRRLLRSVTIPREARSWQILHRLMRRFLHHPYFDQRLKEIMASEEQWARDDMICEM